MNMYEKIAEKRKWDPALVELVWNEAVSQNLNPLLAIAVVAHESNFNPKIYGKRNKNGTQDYGLFQLNSRYHPQFKDDVEGHVRYGVKFLKSQIERYGPVKGLGAYNAGPGIGAERDQLRKAYVKRVEPYLKELYAMMPELQAELSITEQRRNA